MSKSSPLAIATALVTPVIASAAVVTVESPPPVPAPGSVVPVSILVSGGEPISAADVVLSIELEASIPETTFPRFAGGTAIAPFMVFGGNNTGENYLEVTPQIAFLSVGTSSGVVSANGLLMTFLIDTSSATPNVYELILAAELVGASSSEVHGTLTILPEPSAALMLIAGWPLLRRRAV